MKSKAHGYVKSSIKQDYEAGLGQESTNRHNYSIFYGKI
jgi:hypothetical protein